MTPLDFVDLALAGLALEAVVLAVWQPALLQRLAFTLGAGAALLALVHAILAGAGLTVQGLLLATAGICHVADVMQRRHGTSRRARVARTSTAPSRIIEGSTTRP